MSSLLLYPTELDVNEAYEDVETRGVDEGDRQGCGISHHTWTPESDKKLIEAVSLFGMNNWQLGMFFFEIIHFLNLTDS